MLAAGLERRSAEEGLVSRCRLGGFCVILNDLVVITTKLEGSFVSQQSLGCLLEII